MGCAIGSGIGSLQTYGAGTQPSAGKGPGRIHPLMVPMMISTWLRAMFSIQLGLKGKKHQCGTACATGTNNIGEAFRTIQYGDADVMLAGGTESCITPVGIGGFQALTALSTSEDPTRCSPAL